MFSTYHIRVEAGGLLCVNGLLEPVKHVRALLAALLHLITPANIETVYVCVLNELSLIFYTLGSRAG
jgi:hypothetical protein